ncbi:MAG: butanol dehydrogenase [Pelosinus sp.]|jgi:alcohol dehydrogenase YqhD (iron-dependent ADH family)|nr:butanol dehydrogenase [Pelosinus sp.]
MINYNFFNPTKMIFGENTIGQIGSVLSGAGHKKVLLIIGGGSVKSNGVYAKVTDSLKSANIEWSECSGVRANPELSKVQEAIALAREVGIEAVLAVGGGSVIDTAKAVAVGVYLDDVWQAFERKITITRALPIFTILTLSATASEMNSNAVISHTEAGKKWGMGNPFLFPQVSIIDPSVQQSLPWEQTVNGALDALAHIMEFYFVGTVEETTIAINEALMKTIISMVDKLQVNPKDEASRANLAWAATLALNGISGAGLKGGDWACHGIEHSVSSYDAKVAHGAGLGIIFPAWMEYVHANNELQFARFAQSIWQCDTIEQAIEKMRAKIKQWQGQTKLRELNIPENSLAAIAENATMRGSLGSLKKLGTEDVEKILRLAY